MRGKQVRLISENHEHLGIVNFEEAVRRAAVEGLDLIEMTADVSPPVVRVLDYGKHLYEQSKRQREARKKQQQQRIKEVQFHPNIDQHDYTTKVNHAIAFLEKGCKVKISMFFRGREVAHTELGKGVMDRVVADTAGAAAVEMPPRKAGRMISMMLAPKIRK